eukprot:765762-Hanusia_phi.AAC.6
MLLKALRCDCDETGDEPKLPTGSRRVRSSRGRSEGLADCATELLIGELMGCELPPAWLGRGGEESVGRGLESKGEATRKEELRGRGEVEEREGRGEVEEREGRGEVEEGKEELTGIGEVEERRWSGGDQRRGDQGREVGAESKLHPARVTSLFEPEEERAG